LKISYAELAWGTVTQFEKLKAAGLCCMLCEDPEGAVFCLVFLTIEISLSQDRTMRLTNH
jgi:hypothetical protein